MSLTVRATPARSSTARAWSSRTGVRSLRSAPSSSTTSRPSSKRGPLPAFEKGPVTILHGRHVGGTGVFGYTREGNVGKGSPSLNGPCLGSVQLCTLAPAIYLGWEANHRQTKKRRKLRIWQTDVYGACLTVIVICDPTFVLPGSYGHSCVGYILLSPLDLEYKLERGVGSGVF